MVAIPPWFLEWLKSLSEAQKADLYAWFGEEPLAGDMVVDVIDPDAAVPAE